MSSVSQKYMVRNSLDFVDSALNKCSFSLGDETDQRTIQKKNITNVEGGPEDQNLLKIDKNLSKCINYKP